MKSWHGVAVLLGILCAFWTSACPAAEEFAPYINTWLVAGPFDNNVTNAGYDHDWVDEATVTPVEDRSWRYFDDRLFSRNYDDYQDLFSYFHVKRGASVAAKVVYAHVYVYSPVDQTLQLRVGADNEFKAWLNGTPVAACAESRPERDMEIAPVALEAGWNRLLVKVANQENGRLGFYARLTNENGGPPQGLTYSVAPGGGDLSVATKALQDATANALPTAFLEWPYVGARATGREADTSIQAGWLRKPEIALQASDFLLTAAGGVPPYRWALAEGELPEGLSLDEDGGLRGTVAKTARLGDYEFVAKVTDAEGRLASTPLVMTVQDRPNRWFEEARLTALIHGPERLDESLLDEFATVMKRQGYGIGMVISYNNGKYRYRWPSIYDPKCPYGDVVGQHKAALEKAGLKFGMYIGNLDGPNHKGPNGALLLVEDAVVRYHPAAFWFDWAGWNAVSVDAIYSMIKSYDPETVIVLNGVPTMSNGDWDVVNLEGWGAWGERHWDLWPFDFWWPKRIPVETWRFIADPKFDYSRGVLPDWRDYLRIQIALIGAGYVANIDHSASSVTGLDADDKLTDLDASPLMQAHKKMAEWANPPGLPPLYESYTQVNPGPLEEAVYGYNTINLARDAIYLHLLDTPYGKTGKPDSASLDVGPVAQEVKEVVWLNRGQPVAFRQDGPRVLLDLSNVAADPIDTILKLVLAGPHPDVAPPPPPPETAVPPGNLAWHKPARLQSNHGDYALPGSASHFACYGVDGTPFTFACGGNEWDWTFHVDLQAVHRINRIVINFGQGYPTDYKVLYSEDGMTWTTVGQAAAKSGETAQYAFDPAPARYVRIQALKPDGPDQEGGQMNISELEVYEQ